MSQTRENKDLAKGESRILQAGKVGRRLKLIEVRQEERPSDEVDAFVEVEAQDQITVGTKEAEESPLIADMPTPTTPVTPRVGATRSYDSFSS